MMGDADPLDLCRGTVSADPTEKLDLLDTLDPLGRQRKDGAMSGAERTRRWRQRRKKQLRVLLVEVDECDLADCLLDSGLIDLTRADDPAELAAALSRVVKRWAAASV